jgi:hypothetical protein
MCRTTRFLRADYIRTGTEVLLATKTRNQACDKIGLPLVSSVATQAAKIYSVPFHGNRTNLSRDLHAHLDCGPSRGPTRPRSSRRQFFRRLGNIHISQQRRVALEVVKAKMYSIQLLVLLASLSVCSAASSYVGYLISTFTDVNPTVQWYLSKGNDPSTYSFLNKGQPVLKSTVGTKAVRDVYLATNTARSQWFMLGTGKTRNQTRTKANRNKISTSRFLASRGTRS